VRMPGSLNRASCNRHDCILPETETEC
jgi:hypothetical protein